MHYWTGDTHGIGQLMSNRTSYEVGEFSVYAVLTSERWRENCYVVRHAGSGEHVIIDPGGGADSIAEVVLQNGGHAGQIWLTHAHHDHVGAVSQLRRRFNIPCYLHAGDARLLRQAPMYALRFAGERLEAAEGVTTFELDPGLRFGDVSVGVIHTPGHTAGGVCYLLPGIAFTGDTLLFQRVGRQDLPGGDPEALVSSIGRLLQTVPERTLLFPGHGPSWTAGEAKRWWHSLVEPPPQEIGQPA